MLQLDPYQFCDDRFGDELSDEEDTFSRPGELGDLDSFSVGDVTEFLPIPGDDVSATVRRLRNVAVEYRKKTGRSMSYELDGDNIIIRRMRDGSKGRLAPWTALKIGQSFIFRPWSGCTSKGMRLAHMVARLLERRGLGAFRPFIAYDEHVCVKRVA